MIRIAHLIPAMGVGGTEQMVWNLCHFRNRAEFECGMGTPEEGLMVDEIRATGTRVHTGPYAFAHAARDADILNLHWWNYSPALLSYVQALGKPFVTTLHWQLALPLIPALTICTSQETFRIQIHGERCVAVSNGIDLSRFAPRSRSEREEVIITRVCRPSRCALYFWDAMEKILGRYPQTRLRIVGNAPECRPTSARIEFLGVRRDIPQILGDTDIFVYTPYPEAGTNDLVVKEAAAAGIPCVVSDVASVRESVIDGETGYFTPFGDIGAVVDKVGLLVRDAALRARMGRAAIRLARERFDMADVAPRYEAIYRAVVEANGYRR